MEKIDGFSEQVRAGIPFTSKRDGKLPGAHDITLFAAALIAAVISLGEVRLTLQTVRNVSLLVSLLFFLSTLIYRNRYSVALERGKRSERYLSAYAEYDSLRTRLFDSGQSALLSVFCRDCVAAELAGYREGLLAEAGLTYGDYEERYRGQPIRVLRKEYRLTPYAIKAVKKCDGAKGIRLNKNMILLNDGDSGGRNKPFGISSKARQRRDYRLNVLTRLGVTLLSGIVAVDLMVDPTLVTLVRWCVRMLPIVSSAFFGSSSGYTNASETAVNYLSAQCVKIREFFEWIQRTGKGGGSNCGSSGEEKTPLTKSPGTPDP